MKYFKFSNKLFALLFMISSMMYVGCQKEEQKKETIKFSNDVELRTSNTNLEYPVLSNGVLKFIDIDHYKRFYESLHQNLEQGQNSLETLFENKYTSEEFISVASKLRTDEFVDFGDAYSPFLTDPIMMEICNLHYEFQIGDQLVTYINNRQILNSNINDFVTQNKIRNMQKGQTITVNDVPPGAFWGEDTDIVEIRNMPCSCSINIEQFGCNQVRIFGKCRDLLWGFGQANLSVWLNFNSNLPPSIQQNPTFTYSVTGNFEYIYTISSASTIRAVIDPDCISASTKTVQLNFTPSAVSCDKSEKDTGWVTVSNNPEGMRYRLKNYSNWLANYEKAEIESVFWNSQKQKWEKRSADKLQISISASRRNGSCGIDNSDTDSDECKRCRDLNVGVNSGFSGNFFRHCDGDVTATFLKVNNSTTLNATATLDFDCCL
jgi:hypothetical protein